MRLGALEDFGETTWDPDEDRFIIRLDPRWGWAIVRETLCHEWAHALTWDLPGPEHGPQWGVAYAAAYSVLVPEE